MKVTNQKLSVVLILELLENGFTRFQDERTWENDSIEMYLLENFPKIFNKENVRDQINLMFLDERLKGKRTQKVIRPLFTFAEDKDEDILKIEDLHIEQETFDEISIPAIEEEIVEEDVPSFSNENFEENENEELAPWELMG